jgi:hypothetical protein
VGPEDAAEAGAPRTPSVWERVKALMPPEEQAPLDLLADGEPASEPRSDTAADVEETVVLGPITGGASIFDEAARRAEPEDDFEDGSEEWPEEDFEDEPEDEPRPPTPPRATQTRPTPRYQRKPLPDVPPADPGPRTPRFGRRATENTDSGSLAQPLPRSPWRHLPGGSARARRGAAGDTARGARGARGATATLEPEFEVTVPDVDEEVLLDFSTPLVTPPEGVIWTDEDQHAWEELTRAAAEEEEEDAVPVVLDTSAPGFEDVLDEPERRRGPAQWMAAILFLLILAGCVLLAWVILRQFGVLSLGVDLSPIFAFGFPGAVA